MAGASRQAPEPGERDQHRPALAIEQAPALREIIRDTDTPAAELARELARERDRRPGQGGPFVAIGGHGTALAG